MEQHIEVALFAVALSSMIVFFLASLLHKQHVMTILCDITLPANIFVLHLLAQAVFPNNIK